jgi:hypothetical protein
MTRIFKQAVVAGMVVGLMGGSLGLAQADSITAGSIGPVPVPKTGSFVPFDFTVAGQRVHNGLVDNRLGGALTIIWDTQAWAPSYTNLCKATEVGYKFELTAKRADSTITATFTGADGSSTSQQVSPGQVPKGGTATVGLCAE